MSVGKSCSFKKGNFNFCSNFFFLICRLLGALCCCICDPGVNVVTQEIKPAESLGQLLLFHLNSKSALQRISVALVICEWAALQKVRFCPESNEDKISKPISVSC